MAEGRAAVQREGGIIIVGAAMSPTSLRRLYDDGTGENLFRVQPLEVLCWRKRKPCGSKSSSRSTY